jgi:hypothetical protein
MTMDIFRPFLVHDILPCVFVTRVTQPARLVEQGLLAFSKNLRSPPFYGWIRVAQSLVFCVVLFRPLFVLFVLLRIAASGCFFVIFQLFMYHLFVLLQ